MTKNRRGGYRQPSKPAAVATPQGESTTRCAITGSITSRCKS